WWRSQRVRDLHQASVSLYLKTDDAAETTFECIKIVAVGTDRHVEGIGTGRKHEGLAIGVQQREATIAPNAEARYRRISGVGDVGILMREIGIVSIRHPARGFAEVDQFARYCGQRSS